MACLKQVLPVGGKPAVRVCVENILASGIRDVVVVVGHRHEEVVRALDGLPVRFALNEDVGEMSDSVRAGLGEVSSSSPGVMVVLSDHPFVKAETMGTLAGRFLEDPDAVVIPRYDGRGGHPTVFPRSCLARVQEGGTLREAMESAWCFLRVDVPDEGVITDLDYPGDYREAVIRGARKERWPNAQV